MKRKQAYAAVAFSLAASVPAQASETRDYSFLIENDLWVGRTDRWYTNGVRLSWATSGDPDLLTARAFVDANKYLLWGESAPSMSYAIGQAMYSPADITIAEPQPDDRPWGGYLYFAAAAQEFKGADFRRNEVKVGMTGKYSYAAQTQKLVHKWTDSYHPEGWGQQLKQRLGLQLTHVGLHRFGDEPVGTDLFGFQAGYGVSVGTLRVSANANIGMVFGKLEGKNSPIIMGNEGDYVSADFASRKQFNKPFVFVMAGLTGVAYNYFIEGPTPYGRSNLSLRPFYASAQVGASIPTAWEVFDKRIRFVVTMNARQAEFKRRIDGSRGDATKYGGLEIYFDGKD